MADWKKIREEVGEKIAILEALDKELEGSVLQPNVMRDLIKPALTHLARFCACVQEENEPDQGEGNE